MCAISLCSRAEQHKISIKSYRREFICRGNMQKIKSVSPKKALRGSKAFGRHFVEAGNILYLFNQAIGKIWQWSAI